MSQYRVAIATDDKISLIERHFGDAAFYIIYLLTKDNYKIVSYLENKSIEENEDELHGDPLKAKSVSQMLKKEQIQIVVSKQFGPNINRIKKHFVPVSNVITIMNIF